MDRPIREHITFLEQLIQQLNSEIMQNALTKGERNRVQSEIRAAEMAMDYYRKALAIEQTLRQA